MMNTVKVGEAGAAPMTIEEIVSSYVEMQRAMTAAQSALAAVLHQAGGTIKVSVLTLIELDLDGTLVSMTEPDGGITLRYVPPERSAP